MGGETEVIVAVFKAVYFVLTAPYAQLQPYLDRILYFALLILVFRWFWKKMLK